jgi:zinc/manganese transport system permease protein
LITAVLIALVSRGLGRKGNRLEAFIGLIYVLGISDSYVILSKVAHGMEIFQRLIASDILYSSFSETLELLVIYTLIGVLVFYNDTRQEGLKRDLVFFIAFAITVTSSVKMAGVMVVFVMLVGPAMFSLCIHNKNNLIIAWITGTFINSIAILISYHYDLPTGYTIVFCNALVAGCAVVYGAIRVGDQNFRDNNYAD